MLLTVIVCTAFAGEPAEEKQPKQGLSGEYYAGTDFKELKSTHVDAKMEFVGGMRSRSPGEIEKLATSRTGGAKDHSIRWKGQVKSDVDGEYTFYVMSQGSARLWVDDTLLVDNWKPHRAAEDSGKTRLRAERWYDIQLDYARGGRMRGGLRLSYSAKGIEKKVIPPDRLRPVRDVRDPYPDPYKAPPDFVGKFNDYCRRINYGRYEAEFKKRMDLSFEPTFYTLCDLHGYSKPEPRSTALVRAALERERKGEYREALEIYQKIIDDHPDDLYRTSRYGIYVPVAQYCQRRILRFPRRDRAFYRAKHDGRATREYEQARRKNSLEGLAQIVDGLLATSVGGKAVLSLGDSALDRGHYLEALEYYLTVRDVFPDRKLHTPEMHLKIAYCRKMLGEKWAPPKGEPDVESNLTAAQRAALAEMLRKARYRKPAALLQRASAPNPSNDDYVHFPPTADPLGLTEPVWRHGLPGTRHEFFSYTQPVVGETSIIYRHKNIMYARSILTGELRWKNDVGGRVTWQNWQERQYPHEDLLVQDGLVFTPMYKVGPTLVALEETTGQLKWAYGPMVAATPEQARMRFETAPAGGPRTVYAGYVLDNIEGDTHIDTEYGVMAFESTTGRLRWRRPLCRLKPGLFTAGFAVRRRNKIRSFTSPPLYHQGTIYYNTNAGAVAAIDALSGRVKWVMRYPYYAFPQSVHDATRQFGKLTKIHGGTTYCRPHRPMFWLNQRPLLVGEQLYVTPVDTRYMFCLDRRTGRVCWNRVKMGEGFTYFMGPTKTGELVMVTNGRNRRVFGSSGKSGPPLLLLSPETGETVWQAPNLIMDDNQPVMRHYTYNSCLWFSMHERWFENAARPFMTSDGRLYITNWSDVSIWWRPNMHVYHLAEVDLLKRKLVSQRRYYTDALVVHADWIITDQGPKELKGLEELPHKDKRAKEQIGKLKEVLADVVPENRYGPFMPFSRLTFKRYGVLFELRTGPRSIELVYDRVGVKGAVAGRKDPEGLFARAELALGDSRLREAAGLMKSCLGAVSSEDVDFR
ncbi:MAG: PA14 domain-containing protein, partial [Planctomycetota bacterium]